VGAAADFTGFPVRLDGLPAAHLRVLLDGLPVFERYGLLLAGGYAFRAHEILRRPSQDLDFATRNDTPLPDIAEQVQLAFQRAGYSVKLIWHDRFVVRDIVDLHAVAGTFLYSGISWRRSPSRRFGYCNRHSLRGFASCARILLEARSLCSYLLFEVL
jgi:hypothetical protein